MAVRQERPPYKAWIHTPAIPNVDVADVPTDFKLKGGHRPYLAALVNKHKWTRGAELGVFKGTTFFHLLQSCPQLTLIGVDQWKQIEPSWHGETYAQWDMKAIGEQMRQEALRYGERAIVIHASTVKAAEQIQDESLDFIFVDAEHSYEAAKADILAWAPKVKPSGWLLGHDINWPTVKQAVDEVVPGYQIGYGNVWQRRKTV
jgi:predicted O-methyltransferase YrrM